ncbi:hypothetical protein RJT34_32187 [Clitoria ternatea]|uniref:Uncharacterized protein n=1 Tax=Clitoria ternatea TaxID=43366 RepID=A0AAN9I222_CLITE
MKTVFVYSISYVGNNLYMCVVIFLSNPTVILIFGYFLPSTCSVKTLYSNLSRIYEGAVYLERNHWKGLERLCP